MKLFLKRSKLKEFIHNTFKNDNKSYSFFINQKEIRFVNLGINIWFEEDGKRYNNEECRRPVIVLKKIWNLYRVAPLTSVLKNSQSPYYYKINDDQILYHKSTARTECSHIILSQVRVIDKSRFIYKAAEINQEWFSEALKKLKTLLF